MNEEMKMLPIMNPRRVMTRCSQNTEYKIRLARPITDIDDFEEEIMALEEAGEGDIIFMQLSSPGGNLETCDFLCRRMNESAAPIVVEIGMTCASAASAMMLQADDWIIRDSSTVMIHACSYSPGWGKEVDMWASASYTNRLNREWLERTYRGFLSDQELQTVLDGKDLYFFADDLRERLPKYQEYRQSLSEAGCGDPECSGCSEDFDDEPEFNLIELIEQKTEDAVTKALDKILKKYNIVEKEKPARKAPAKKSVDKVVDKPSPEA